MNSTARLPKYVDYKDIPYLSGFVTPHGRIMSARKTDMPAGHQRKIETAIKRARFMALLPYVAR